MRSVLDDGDSATTRDWDLGLELVKELEGGCEEMGDVGGEVGSPRIGMGEEDLRAAGGRKAVKRLVLSWKASLASSTISTVKARVKSTFPSIPG